MRPLTTRDQVLWLKQTFFKMQLKQKNERNERKKDTFKKDIKACYL